MPRVPDVPCADCGRLLFTGRGSLPSGARRCLSCRRARPTPSTRAPSTRRELVHACQRCGVPLDVPSRLRRYCGDECHRRHRVSRGSGARPSASARGYGYAHAKRRAATIGAAVGTPCVLCGGVMDDPSDMHLDHTPDRNGYRGFAHADCNVRDGARRAVRRG